MGKEKYTREELERAEERGKRLGLIQGVEEFESRLIVDFHDDEDAVDIIKKSALKFKRKIERRSLLK